MALVSTHCEIIETCHTLIERELQKEDVLSFADELYQKRMISFHEREVIMATEKQSSRAYRLVNIIRHKVIHSPTYYDKFVDVLRNRTNYNDLVKILEDCLDLSKCELRDKFLQRGRWFIVTALIYYTHYRYSISLQIHMTLYLPDLLVQAKFHIYGTIAVIHAT